MIIKLQRILKISIIVLLLPAFIALPDASLIAKSKTSVTKSKKSKKSKRHYNSSATRQQAIQIIRTSSESVSELAGLDPMVDPNTKTDLIKNDSEVYEEGEDVAELEREDDVTIDIETFKMLWLSYVDEGEADDFTAGGIAKSEIMRNIMEILGTPYHFGGRTLKGIDCSGFVQKIFLETNNVMLPRTARDQYTVGKSINRENLEFGDLVFFNTRKKVYVSHVGIYLGDNLFAHSSSRYGVTVSSLESTYYNKRLIGGVRLTANDVLRMSRNKDIDKSNQ